VGTAISIVGVLMIVGVNTLTNSSLNLGSMLAISASFFYAAYLLTTQQIRTQMDTISFTTVSMASSTLVLFLFSIVGDFQLTGYSTHSWLSLAGMGLISQLSGWLLINYALGYIKSTIASVSLLSQSVFTALLSIPVLHETLDFGEILGAIVVLAGIFLVNMFKKK
jgi:drug/metabolite transporter (DMT)-like permease